MMATVLPEGVPGREFHLLVGVSKVISRIGATGFMCVISMVLLSACDDGAQAPPAISVPPDTPGARAEVARLPHPTDAPTAVPTRKLPEDPAITRTPTETTAPALSPSPTPAPAAIPRTANTATIVPVPTEPSVQTPEACRPHNVGEIDLFAGAAGAAGAAAHSTAQGGPTVEEILRGEHDSGLAGPPVHIAMRWIASWDSVRCAWHGTAMTVEQREQPLRFWIGLDENRPLPLSITGCF